MNSANDLSLMRQFTRKGTVQAGNLNLTSQLDNSKDHSKADAGKPHKPSPKPLLLPPLDVIDEEKTPQHSSSDCSRRTAAAETEHPPGADLRDRHGRAGRHVERHLSR